MSKLLYMYQLKDKTLQKLLKTVKLLNCKCWVWSSNQMFPDLRHYISPSLRSPQRVLQRIKQGWMQPDDRTQIAKQVGPIVWNALSSAKSGFILRYSRYHQQPPIMHSINWKYCPDFTILSTFCLLWVKTAKVGSLVTILVLHDHWPSLWSNVLLLYPFIEIVCIWSETCCATK